MNWTKDLQEDWFDINAPLNVERKFNHGEDCGQAGADYRNRLYVKRTDKGWVWHCHNCGKSGTRDYSGIELAKWYCNGGIRRECNNAGASQENTSDDFRLPERINFTTEGRAWINKYGIRDYELQDYNIYESPSGISLCIYGSPQISNVRSVCGFQLRRVSGNGPKYKTILVPGVKNPVWKSIPRSDAQNGSTVVLVEDILSGIKVGRYRAAWALLGSPKRLPESTCEALAGASRRVVIWLDRDKAMTGDGYCARLRRVYGLNTAQVITKKDPKEHSDAELSFLLTEADTLFT